MCNGLLSYLNEIDYSAIKEQSQAYKLIEKNLGRDFIILDFNYTNSVKNILISKGYPPDFANERIIKVHGSAEAGDIIFGVEDNARIHRNHIFLKKSCNIYYKPIHVKNFLESAKRDIFLWSFIRKTDHTYFKDYFFELAISPSTKIAEKIELYYFWKTRI